MGLHSLTLDDISWNVIWRRRATVSSPRRRQSESVDRDVALLFATRCLRMFGYASPVVLVLYLTSLGLGGDVGLLLALTLLGDAAISLWLTTHADRIGRRRVLLAGAALMLVAGLAFVATPVFACCSSRRPSASSAPAATRSARSWRSSRLAEPARPPDAPDPRVRAVPAGRLVRDRRRGARRRAWSPSWPSAGRRRPTPTGW